MRKKIKKIQTYANVLMIIGMFLVAIGFWIHALTQSVFATCTIILGLIITKIGAGLWDLTK